MAQAYHAVDAFPFIAVLERHWREIRDEYRAVRARLAGWGERDLHDGGWEVFGIFDFPDGAALPEGRALCPTTAALIERYIPGHGAAGFSRLAPGTRIRPHRGFQGRFLRCHLGLEVPPGDCALEVEGDVRRWEEGRAIVFDDRLAHAAWNESAAPRVVLLVDFIPG